MKSGVTAIINGYKRAHNVDQIVLSLLNQTCPPESIFIWWNDKTEFTKSHYARYCNNIISYSNLGGQDLLCIECFDRICCCI